MNQPTVYRPAVERPPEGLEGERSPLTLKAATVAAVVLQLAGIVAVVVGAFELAIWFGLVVAGAAALLVGIYFERAIHAHEGVADARPTE